MKTGIKIFRPKERKPKSIGNVTFLLFRLDGEARSTIKLLFILYFVSGPGSESESKSVPESESIRSPKSESESESEQPHHDSAPLAQRKADIGRKVLLPHFSLMFQ